MARTADHALRRGSWSAGVITLLLPLALVACDTAGSEDKPGGVSKGEAGSLDEAAERLDRQRLPEGAVPPVNLPVAQQAPTIAQDNEDGPAKSSQDPE